jgi:monothiol glutaredoxin
VVLFMKGNPMAPQCGFSASAAATLTRYHRGLKTVDIIIDPEVRGEVKAYSSWPTIPQIYIAGEFVGGSDILRQMDEAGDLEPMVKAAVAAAEAASAEAAPAEAAPAEGGGEG